MKKRERKKMEKKMAGKKRITAGNASLLIVKRHGKQEPFDERKVYGSVYAACHVVRVRERDCERIAHAVSRRVKAFMLSERSVPAAGIAKIVEKELRKYNEHAAFMYATHRDVG